jgi:hypothetical protein
MECRTLVEVTVSCEHGSEHSRVPYNTRSLLTSEQIFYSRRRFFCSQSAKRITSMMSHVMQNTGSQDSHEKYVLHELMRREICMAWLVNRKEENKTYIVHTNKQTPSESASELYRPSDRRFSAKWLPNFADKGCHVWRIPTAVFSVF